MAALANMPVRQQRHLAFFNSFGTPFITFGKVLFGKE